MDKQEYNEIIEALTDHRKGVSDSKREDYTKGSEDVLANFKSVAESTGVSTLQVWLVYTQKHFDAISNYVRTNGQSESEPIKERFGDLLNYLELGWSIIKEEGTENIVHGALELNDEPETMIKGELCDCDIPRSCGFVSKCLKEYQKSQTYNVPESCQSPETCGETPCTCPTNRSTGI